MSKPSSKNTFPKTASGKLEKFPTIVDNTYPKEVKHREIVTKQDILNFNLTKIDNRIAFKDQLSFITNPKQKYILEFIEQQIFFKNEN